MRRFADFFQFMPTVKPKYGWINEPKANFLLEKAKINLKKIPVFVIDNVADWYFGAKSDSVEIPNNEPFQYLIAPPFNEFWMEYSTPKCFIQDSTLGQELFGFHCFITSSGISDGGTDRWQMKIIRYMCANNLIGGPIDQCISIIHKDGQCNHYDYETLVYLDRSGYEVLSSKEAYKFFEVCFIALHFASCPKVEVKEVTAPKRLLGRKALKRGEKQPINYKVLDIEPLKVILKTEGEIEQVGWKQALTKVRGHWRTYTPERPLFGHFVGKIFIKDHPRGSKDVGIVNNTYNVKSPSSKEQE